MLWPSKLCFIETTDFISNYLELCSFSGPRKGSVLERTKQTKILECTQPKEDMGGWTGRARWQRQPRQNGAYREHFYLRQDCTEPIPDARVAAFDRTGSNPNSSPFPSAHSFSEAAHLSKWQQIPPLFTGSKPASMPLLGTFRHRQNEQKVNNCDLKYLKPKYHLCFSGLRSFCKNKNNIWKTKQNDKERAQIARRWQQPPSLWVINAWQEYPNRGWCYPSHLAALFPQSTLKTHFLV